MDHILLNISQLGYTPESKKTVSLICKSEKNLPDKIPFYIQDAGSRLKRNQPYPPGWKGRFFRWPFKIGSGDPSEEEVNYKSHTEKPLYKGYLIKNQSRWGTIWQGDFTDFSAQGIYQIETRYQMTVPFEINPKIYERALHSYLTYIYSQRSGFNIPGVRSAEHLDDAILDTTREQVDAPGGWYDAGDFRKWLTLTQGNLHALKSISQCGIPEFEEKAKEEIRWGNSYFHSMINDEGQVYEDVGGGTFKEGLDYDRDWWYENHPGCNCDNAGNIITDNIQGSGDERLIRTNYNPFVQFQFTYYQAMIASVSEGEYASRCRMKAEKAWRYGINAGHDNRTIYLCAQLMAAAELHPLAPDLVTIDKIEKLTRELLSRQNKDQEGISGYFTEKDNSDGYRSIAFSNFPVQALFNVYKNYSETELRTDIAESIARYVESYLMEDAKSNPFSVIPYGVYHDPPYPDIQVFRNAGKGKFIRTFIHPVNDQEIIHGTNSVLVAHAAFLAEAARVFKKPHWKDLSETLIGWGMGHNTVGLSLFTGIGYKHPVLFSGVHVQIPFAACAGYIGTPEDNPYMETSNWIEWSTQEVWDVPHYELAIAATFLMKDG